MTSPARPMRFIFPRALCQIALAISLSLSFHSSHSAEPRDIARLSTELCVGCHGPNLNGGPAPSLLDNIWKTGSDDDSILRAIRDGFPQANMPPFAAVLSDEEQRRML